MKWLDDMSEEEQLDLHLVTMEWLIIAAEVVPIELNDDTTTNAMLELRDALEAHLAKNVEA